MEEYELENNNLFKYATKELSQDAFICWLASWYDNKYKDCEMYNVSKSFLNKIIEKANQKEFIELEDYKIRIDKQYKHIDVLISLTDKYDDVKKCIIIEDKTFSEEHDSQIKAYKNKLEKNYKNLKPKDFITVYYKMINYDEKSNADVNINVDDMLEIMNNNNIKNDIYNDYKKYLKKLKCILENYKKIKFRDWSKNREIFYKFQNDYNCNNNYKIKAKEVQIQSGGIYIDFENLEISNEMLKDGLYVALNFMNKEKLYIEIRGKNIENFTKEKKDKISNDIKMILEKEKITKKYPIKEIVINNRNYNKNKFESISLLKLILDNNKSISLDEFNISQFVTELYECMANL